MQVRDEALAAELRAVKALQPFFDREPAGAVVGFDARSRGVLKHCLLKLGWPVHDEAGYRVGHPLAIALGDSCSLRGYQRDAADAFHRGGTNAGGCGVVVLPCGAGKTVVGLAVMERVGAHTLVLTTNSVAVRQWKRELLDKTRLGADEIGEYTGERKEIRPVTIATYQILTHRRRRVDPFTHWALLEAGDWGLIVYDEVHLLPAPVFRATAAMQARRRLGLTATLIREDGREGDVFSLIGPKRYELPWRDLERAGWLATARCVEVRVPFDDARGGRYRAAGARERVRIASGNPRKLEVVARLLEQHASDRVLVIGHYLDQLREMAQTFRTPLITGQTPFADRERLFGEFRSGRIRRLMVSKVGNFAIDLPDANVMIQVSGTYGSRQEEAQRLGRILRPKADGGEAFFWSLVTQGSCEEEYSQRRQLFLTEQGYGYAIRSAADLCGGIGREVRA
jgi:DNA excision repair protein ERCC-3